MTGPKYATVELAGGHSLTPVDEVPPEARKGRRPGTSSVGWEGAIRTVWALTDAPVLRLDGASDPGGLARGLRRAGIDAVTRGDVVYVTRVVSG